MNDNHSVDLSSDISTGLVQTLNGSGGIPFPPPEINPQGNNDSPHSSAGAGQKDKKCYFLLIFLCYAFCPGASAPGTLYAVPF